MKIALAQINPKVGDFQNNAKIIRSFIDCARNRGAELVVFPELAVTGYPPKDLLDVPSFIDENINTLDEIVH